MHALATPLMVKADGTKFGKSESGAVWLDPEMTTPYAFYQFWLNVDDRDISPYMRILSFRSRAELEELEKLTEERPQARTAQRALAEELTTLVHGAEQCASVIAASKALFGQGELGDLDEATLSAALSEVPHAEVTELGPLVDLLVEVGLAPSKSGARRTVKEGGAYVNNVKVVDGEAAPAREELLHGRWLVLRRGKKNLAAIEVTAALTGSGRHTAAGHATCVPGRRRVGRPADARACTQAFCFLVPRIDVQSMSPRPTMTTAPISWSRWRVQSMPLVSLTPIHVATALPMTLPMMPKMVVSQSGICCFPGRIAFAIRPRTRPTMIAHSQLMSPPGAARCRACAQVLAHSPYDACRTGPYVPWLC